MIVDFFIVGAPKSGTTSLYFYLNEHSEIEMSSQKEPDFFSDKPLQKQNMYYRKARIDTIKKYNSLFTKRNVSLRGEASVSYLFYDEVPHKIFSYNPDAKIIIMLRDPVDRAFSHYLMDFRLGLISESFEAIINKHSTDKNADLFYQQYIKVSEYSSQVKRYLEVFSRENIYFIDYDDFKNNTSDVIDSVLIFLGLSHDFKPHLSKQYNTYNAARNSLIHYIYSFATFRKILSIVFPRVFRQNIRSLLFTSRDKPELSDDTRGLLKNHFKSNVNELSEILKKDFSKWIK